MRAAESKRDDAVMNDPYAELLAGDAGGAFLQVFSKWSPRMDTMSDFVALRTRSIDEALVHRHASIQQIVILGAGLDSRAYRMKSLADCLVIEVDTSASMMERKQKLLDDAGAAVLAKQRHVIIADLEQDLWATELIANGFNPKVPAFWLLEGLLYYLSEDSNVRLVKTIDALSAKHSQLWADIGGYALVKGGDSEGEGLFRARALKYGENDPTNGVLSLLKWSMEIQLSLNEKQELYGREWQPMKVPSSETGEEEVVPWFFVEISKTQEHPSEKPLL
jgi:methyltransferase (TIGR00027 family)